MDEFLFGESLDWGRGLGLSTLSVQNGFGRDRVREGAEVEGPDVPADCLVRSKS